MLCYWVKCHLQKVTLTLKTNGARKAWINCFLKFSDTFTRKLLFIFHIFKLFYKKEFQETGTETDIVIFDTCDI